ncbi:efflux RND transporter periplasmic adaptor subunit [Stutzerimonas kirkiae]|uniref:Efflux RND transporter periplasmic adaptor subunit n=1 Tax=Stutzerimonas kirkiae TaxID=2211392 RepID=A0A4Q9RCL6_9GAMM|nr:efflux RND transporter periplasmic adaptor subunit [Stutzerimonas kirkiae]TBU98103.1 efflux RND transporter periplasmic adaptor subunit [Stutzerimonas kirkiae]TBV02382.1 efflux RND transporter periplasmic adaptor subunit [Stutzerimonas kirkiae]TBV11154.1 efflux RND transporter periplasmic adaptor subunit [Stutzerimonas kirkiae]
MFRNTLRFAGISLFALSGLLACGGEPPRQSGAKPVMVVQPSASSEAQERYPGEVHARYEPELAFRIGGKVVERLVESGDRVSKEQPLARLDPQDVRLQLDAVRAQVAAAEANQRVARAEYERYRTLLGRQLVSKSQYDSAENAYQAAAAQLRQLSAELEVASNQVDYAVLRATRDGVIAERRVEVGQVLAAGQTAFVLAADGEREVAINLPEQALQRYRVGRPVTVELWSQPGARFAGSIRELSPVADAQTRTYSARVAFEAPEVAVELGQSALVTIDNQAQAQLTVPLSALSAERGRAYVWRVQADSTLERVEVSTGRYGESVVPVLDGLGERDWVVLAGVQLLHEGQAVRPISRDNRPVSLVQE